MKKPHFCRTKASNLPIMRFTLRPIFISFSRHQNSLRDKKENNSIRLPNFKNSVSSIKPLPVSAMDADQASSVYQSVGDIDELSTESFQMNCHSNSITPYSKLRYIDSVVSDEYMSSSRTMPSIKESCLGTCKNHEVNSIFLLIETNILTNFDLKCVSFCRRCHVCFSCSYFERFRQNTKPCNRLSLVRSKFAGYWCLRLHYMSFNSSIR